MSLSLVLYFYLLFHHLWWNIWSGLDSVVSNNVFWSLNVFQQFLSRQMFKMSSVSVLLEMNNSSRVLAVPLIIWPLFTEHWSVSLKPHPFVSKGGPVLYKSGLVGSSSKLLAHHPIEQDSVLLGSLKPNATHLQTGTYHNLKWRRSCRWVFHLISIQDCHWAYLLTCRSVLTGFSLDGFSHYEVMTKVQSNDWK